MNFNFSPLEGQILRRGAQGPMVRLLQEALAAAGFNPGKCDSAFGPATESAVQAFQAEAGLSADGVFGPKTLKALARRLAGGAAHSALDVNADDLLTPAVLLPMDGLDRLGRQMARLYNDLGGLFEELARELEMPVPLALAVFKVECPKSTGFDPENSGKLIVRFEPHQFRKFLGSARKAEFDLYFQVGVPSWQGEHHRYSPAGDGVWLPFHGDQAAEWAALELARTLDDTAAVKSASYGGPQIMGFNHESAGYTTPQAMVEAFSTSTAAQVRAFFRFVSKDRGGKMLAALRRGDLTTFVTMYNGDGQVPVYKKLMEEAAAALEKALKAASRLAA